MNKNSTTQPNKSYVPWYRAKIVVFFAGKYFQASIVVKANPPFLVWRDATMA